MIHKSTFNATPNRHLSSVIPIALQNASLFATYSYDFKVKSTGKNITFPAVTAVLLLNEIASTFTNGSIHSKANNVKTIPLIREKSFDLHEFLIRFLFLPVIFIAPLSKKYDNQKTCTRYNTILK